MKPESPVNFYDVEPLTNWIQSGVPVITPNYRLARHIKLAWGQRQQAQGYASWEPPLVMSLEHWWLHCRQLADPWGESPTRLASESQELELWLHCIRSNPDSENLLRPNGAARQARDAYQQLLLWQLDWRRETLASEFRLSADGTLFLQWAEQFEALCTNIGLKLLNSLVPELAQQAPCAQMVLVEFEQLPPLYEQALQDQVSDLHRHNHRGSPAACRLMPCLDSEQELYAAAHWASQALREDSNTSVAILLSDPGQQRHQCERILTEVFQLEGGPGRSQPVNFSGGSPLSQTASVRTALSLLSLLQPEVELEALAQILHSRYRNQREQGKEMRLCRDLYQQGRAIIGAAQLRYASRDLALGSQLLRLSQQRELKRRHLPSRWCELFSEALLIFEWPGEGPLDSEEFQQVEHWYQCLDRVAALDDVCQTLDYNEASALLLRVSGDMVFQPQTADAPIQVLGFLEAAGLSFQRLWLTGMASANWPPPARPNPFIPFGLQRSRGMPHASSEREHEYAQGLLEQYRHSSEELVASFTAVQDDIAQRPSPLLAGFTTLPMPAVHAHPETWQSYGELAVEQLNIESHAPVLGDAEAMRLRGGSGLIQDQSQCGFRAFVQHRLKARARRELTVGLTPSDRGTLLHDALFHLWGNLQDSETLHKQDETQLLTLVNLAAENALEKFSSRNRELVGKTYLELEQSHLELLLRQWLDVERQRSAFVVKARETDCELQLGKLHIRLRIDRIDLLPDGTQFIVDYKSGNAQVRYWLGPRPSEPQLPLYSEALGDTVSGIGFAVVRPQDIAWRGLARDSLGPGISTDIARAHARQEEVLEDWDALRLAWQQTLQALAQQFVDGEARVDPLDANLSCRWCGLQPLCRIVEVSDHGGH